MLKNTDQDNKAALLMFSSTPCSIFRPAAGRPLPSRSVIGPQCPCCPQWGCGLGKGLLTSVIESRGSAHPPLSLIHSGGAGAAHLHADIGHLLRLQGPHITMFTWPNWSPPTYFRQTPGGHASVPGIRQERELLTVHQEKLCLFV